MVIKATGVITKTRYKFNGHAVKGVAYMKGKDMDDQNYPDEFIRVIFKKPIDLGDGSLYEAVDVCESYDQLNQQLTGKQTAN